MKTPRRALSYALFALLTGACAVSNSDYCAQDSDCTDAERCSAASSRCESIQAADAGTEPPEGWQGPFMLSVGDIDRDPMPCEFEGQSEEARLGRTPVGAGSCACACGAASELRCEGAELQTWTGSESSCESDQCGGGSCIAATMPMEPGQCTEISAAMGSVLRMEPGELVDGSCSDAPTAVASLDAPTFAEEILLCSPSAPALACGLEGSTEDCAALEAHLFEATLCVAQEGIHECPTGSAFQERQLYHREIEDSRQCEATSCSCAPPSGLGCGGALLLANDEQPGCNTLVDIVELGGAPSAQDSCSAAPQAARAVYSPATAGHQCVAEGSASLHGSLEGSAPVTVCCLPQEP